MSYRFTPPRPGIARRRFAATAIAAIAALGASAQRLRAGTPTPLRIGGTGMALGTMRQIGDAYAATQTGVALQVLPSLGTSGGLAAVAAGAIELGLAARPLNDAELAKGLQGFAYARTPVAFVTHPGTDVSDITMKDVAQILRGRMTTWPSGEAIRLVRREPSDADWTMLRGVSPEMADAVRIALERPGLLTTATDQDNADALERLPGSFGAMSIGQVRAEKRRVVPLILDGVPPMPETLAGGSYRLSRTLHIVWLRELRSDVAPFLAFLRSPTASDRLAQLGHIPLAGPGA